MDGYELVQYSPERIYRKISINPQENNTKNEYFWVNGEGVISNIPYPSIDEAIKAKKEWNKG